MNLINRVKDKVLDNDFKITIIKNKINIVSYTKIGDFSSTKIIIYHYDLKYIINGTSLVISKLLDDEILVTGNFNSIEFR